LFRRGKTPAEGEEMTHPEDERSTDQRERYVGYATYCLQSAKVATDEYSRAILRQMAKEWLTLAEKPVD
jgi:hypothetical protein